MYKKVLLTIFIFLTFSITSVSFAETKQAISPEQIEKTRVLAEKGDATAQFNLGLSYFKGQGGLEKNEKKAVFYWKKAAGQGLPPAQFNLGYIYREGKGLEKDLVQAVFWWRKAAEQGLPQSQYNLGIAYEEGWGVEKIRKKPFFGTEKRLNRDMLMLKTELASLTGMEPESGEIPHCLSNGRKKQQGRGLQGHSSI